MMDKQKEEFREGAKFSVAIIAKCKATLGKPLETSKKSLFPISSAVRRLR